MSDTPVAGTTVTVCATCAAGRAGLGAALALALADARLTVVLRETDCMSGCARPSTVAFRAPGKTAYLFGDLTGADIPDLVRFVRLYGDSPDGAFPDARPLGALRMKAIARIPG